MATKDVSAKQTLLFFWSHIRRHPGYVVGFLVGIPLTVLIYQFLPPLILADVLRRLSTGDFEPNEVWASFGPELLAYAGLMLFGGVIAWRIIDILDWKLEGIMQRSIARQIFRHLLSESANFHANNFGGSLVSQSSKLLGAYIRTVDTTVFLTIPLIASIIWGTTILFFKVPQYAVLLLGFSLFFIVTAFFVTRPVRKLSARHATLESSQTGYLADNITNVLSVKSFAGQEFEEQAFAKITDRTRLALREMMYATQKQQAYFSVVNNSILAMSLTMAVISVMLFEANVGTVFLMLTYTASITLQLWNFGNNALKTYNRALGDAQEMVGVLANTPEVLDPEKPEKVRIKKGDIHFYDMNFAHPDSKQDDVLFSKFNLHIAPGEKIGLVGHSGSGKSTLTRLLLRFSDIDNGQILIDDQNIANITQDDLRRHIAYVPQEPLLFHRTIRENIEYGRPGASTKQVVEAAHKAFAHEFIEKLPKGYDTLVGERGVKLSGGQRQRIVIARAILKDAPILVLDEATSALDSESEKLIQAALWELMKGRTAIVIAHRLSTIQKMDRIVVLDNGQIAEQGSHQTLLKHKGTYAKLWAHQSGGFIEE